MNISGFFLYEGFLYYYAFILSPTASDPLLKIDSLESHRNTDCQNYFINTHENYTLKLYHFIIGDNEPKVNEK